VTREHSRSKHLHAAAPTHERPRIVDPPICSVHLIKPRALQWTNLQGGVQEAYEQFTFNPRHRNRPSDAVQVARQTHRPPVPPACRSPYRKVKPGRKPHHVNQVRREDSIDFGAVLLLPARCTAGDPTNGAGASKAVLRARLLQVQELIAFGDPY